MRLTLFIHRCARKLRTLLRYPRTILCYLLGHKFYEDHYWYGGYKGCKSCNYKLVLWLPCRLVPGSNRMCERGTKTCNVDHTALNIRDETTNY